MCRQLPPRSPLPLLPHHGNLLHGHEDDGQQGESQSQQGNPPLPTAAPSPLIDGRQERPDPGVLLGVPPLLCVLHFRFSGIMEAKRPDNTPENFSAPPAIQWSSSYESPGSNNPSCPR